jgi:predicted Zn-dependent protease
VRFGSDVYRFVFATKRKTPELDRVFREAVGTFRRMTLSEIQSTRPSRLKVVSAQPGDTVDKIGTHMAVADHPLERFLVLNGLQPGQALKPGEQVKVVVE